MSLINGSQMIVKHDQNVNIWDDELYGNDMLDSPRLGRQPHETITKSTVTDSFVDRVKFIENETKRHSNSVNSLKIFSFSEELSEGRLKNESEFVSGPLENPKSTLFEIRNLQKFPVSTLKPRMTISDLRRQIGNPKSIHNPSLPRQKQHKSNSKSIIKSSIIDSIQFPKQKCIIKPPTTNSTLVSPSTIQRIQLNSGGVSIDNWDKKDENEVRSVRGKCFPHNTLFDIQTMPLKRISQPKINIFNQQKNGNESVKKVENSRKIDILEYERKTVKEYDALETNSFNSENDIPFKNNQNIINKLLHNTEDYRNSNVSVLKKMKIENNLVDNDVITTTTMRNLSPIKIITTSEESSRKLLQKNKNCEVSTKMELKTSNLFQPLTRISTSEDAFSVKANSGPTDAVNSYEIKGEQHNINTSIHQSTHSTPQSSTVISSLTSCNPPSTLTHNNKNNQPAKFHAIHQISGPFGKYFLMREDLVELPKVVRPRLRPSVTKSVATSRTRSSVAALMNMGKCESNSQHTQNITSNAEKKDCKEDIECTGKEYSDRIPLPRPSSAPACCCPPRKPRVPRNHLSLENNRIDIGDFNVENGTSRLDVQQIFNLNEFLSNNFTKHRVGSRREDEHHFGSLHNMNEQTKQENSRLISNTNKIVSVDNSLLRTRIELSQRLKSSFSSSHSNGENIQNEPSLSIIPTVLKTKSISVPRVAKLALQKQKKEKAQIEKLKMSSQLAYTQLLSREQEKLEMHIKRTKKLLEERNKTIDVGGETSEGITPSNQTSYFISDIDLLNKEDHTLRSSSSLSSSHSSLLETTGKTFQSREATLTSKELIEKGITTHYNSSLKKASDAKCIKQANKSNSHELFTKNNDNSQHLMNKKATSNTYTDSESVLAAPPHKCTHSMSSLNKRKENYSHKKESHLIVVSTPKSRHESISYLKNVGESSRSTTKPASILKRNLSSRTFLSPGASPMAKSQSRLVSFVLSPSSRRSRSPNMKHVNEGDNFNKVFESKTDNNISSTYDLTTQKILLKQPLIKALNPLKKASNQFDHLCKQNSANKSSSFNIIEWQNLDSRHRENADVASVTTLMSEGILMTTLKNQYKQQDESMIEQAISTPQLNSSLNKKKKKWFNTSKVTIPGVGGQSPPASPVSCLNPFYEEDSTEVDYFSTSDSKFPLSNDLCDITEFDANEKFCAKMYN